MIATWTVGHANVNMAEDILVNLIEIIHLHPWWKARAKLAAALLKKFSVHPPARVMDAGCGWGVTLLTLEKRGYRMAGLDISRQALSLLDTGGRQLIEADLTQDLPPSCEAYDAVLSLDVIEHLDDDRSAVRRLGQLAVPGGVVIVSVPALPELFSEFDAIQGHRRRYLPETLAQAFQGSGLVLEDIFWWGAWLVPLLRRQRTHPIARAHQSASETYRRYLSVPPWPLSRVLEIAFDVDQFRTLRKKPRTGTSLFAIARRPR
jgi:cyclopropane fatty-acyl-phospholipid synthase-like methyltransferase